MDPKQKKQIERLWARLNDQGKVPHLETEKPDFLELPMAESAKLTDVEKKQILDGIIGRGKTSPRKFPTPRLRRKLFAVLRPPVVFAVGAAALLITILVTRPSNNPLKFNSSAWSGPIHKWADSQSKPGGQTLRVINPERPFAVSIGPIFLAGINVPLIESHGNSGELRIGIEEGTLFVRLDPGAQMSLTVAAGSTEVKVTGTDLFVRKSKSIRTQVYVMNGSVEVTTSTTKRMLLAGQLWDGRIVKPISTPFTIFSADSKIRQKQFQKALQAMSGVFESGLAVDKPVQIKKKISYTIHLKTGETMVGTITKITPKEVVIQNAYAGDFTIQRDNIVSTKPPLPNP